MSLYVIIMGVQGAGKGMQANYIHTTYDIPHVSTGEIFRAMRDREDDLARKVQEIMAAGKLVSDEVTNEVLRDRLEQADAANGAVLDGYPRNIAQAAWLESYLEERGASLSAVLLLELDLYTAFKRAFGRVLSSQDSTLTYNIYSNAEGVEYNFVEDENSLFPARLEAKLIGTDEALVRRPDDANAQSIIKRIDTYLETTQPLIEYYNTKGLLNRIDASQSIEQVSADIRQAIEKAKTKA